MHQILQDYLKEMYDHSIKDADSIDLLAALKKNMSDEFMKAKEETGKNPCTKEEMVEFYQDGISILDFFKKNRNDYFSKNGYELVGIELQLDADLKNNVSFVGYIDIVIKDAIANKYKIIDFKTSTMGWRDYQKNDDNKTSQIVLYKKFYSDKFKVPVDSIEVEFVILKRKLYENTDYPQKRIQKFSPASGTPTINKTIKILNEFVENSFTKKGEYNITRIYKKAENNKACKYCEFSGNLSVCNRKNINHDV
jgi:hypothetical protein